MRLVPHEFLLAAFEDDQRTYVRFKHCYLIIHLNAFWLQFYVKQDHCFDCRLERLSFMLSKQLCIDFSDIRVDHMEHVWQHVHSKIFPLHVLLNWRVLTQFKSFSIFFNLIWFNFSDPFFVFLQIQELAKNWIVFHGLIIHVSYVFGIFMFTWFMSSTILFENVCRQELRR